MSEERNFKDDVRINKHALHKECANHANIYYHWSHKLAEAKAEKDVCDDKLKLTMAKREIVIREDLKNAGVKITESIVKAELEQDSEVLAARNALIEAKKEVYLLDAAVSAMEHRKGKLDNLVQLYIKNYYSQPDGGSTKDVNDDYSGEARKKLKRKKENDNG